MPKKKKDARSITSSASSAPLSFEVSKWVLSLFWISAARFGCGVANTTGFFDLISGFQLSLHSRQKPCLPWFIWSMLPPTFQIISSEGIGRINRLISFLSFLPFFCVRLGWWLWLRVAIASKGLSLSCRRHGSAKIWLAAELCTRFPHRNRLIRFFH